MLKGTLISTLTKSRNHEGRQRWIGLEKDSCVLICMYHVDWPTPRTDSNMMLDMREGHDRMVKIPPVL